VPGYHQLRLPDAYRALTVLEPRQLAWEWLRRDLTYRDAWASARPSVRRVATLAANGLQHAVRKLIDIPQPRPERRWSLWGLSFPGRS
jgi:hypothetical protein